MYSDLYEALDDLSTNQIKVTLKGDGDHSIMLDGLCNDGLVEVLRHLVNEMDLSSDEVLVMIPQLKKLSVTDLLGAALSGGSLDLGSLLENLPSEAPRGASGDVRVGDTFTYTRKVTGVYPDSVTYEDDNGKTTNVLKSSFKGWTKNKRKS